MPNKITSRLQDVVSNSEALHDNPKTQEFMRASERFEKLVEEGKVEKRGYTLMPSDEAHLHQMSFNVK